MISILLLLFSIQQPVFSPHTGLFQWKSVSSFLSVTGYVRPEIPFNYMVIFALLVAIIFLLLFKYILLKREIATSIKEYYLNHQNELKQFRHQFYSNLNKDFKSPLSSLLHSLEDYHDKEKEKSKKENIKDCIRNVKIIQHKLNTWPEKGEVQEDKIILERLKNEIHLQVEEIYPVNDSPSIKKILETTDQNKGLESVENLLEDHILAEGISLRLSNADEKLLKNVMSYVRSNLENTDLTVEGMSKALGLSRNHLHRKLKALTGQSPVEFIKTIRMSYAAHFLKTGKWSVSEIGYKVGYNTPSYFSTSFTNHYGMSPTAYIESESPQSSKGQDEKTLPS